HVLGEIPALLFLLAGFLCFIFAEKRPWVWMPVVICLWSLALLSKVQVLPFFTTGLILPFSFTLFRRQWKSASLFGVALFGSIVLKFFLEYLQARVSPVGSVTGL